MAPCQLLCSDSSTASPWPDGRRSGHSGEANLDRPPPFGVDRLLACSVALSHKWQLLRLLPDHDRTVGDSSRPGSPAHRSSGRSSLSRRQASRGTCTFTLLVVVSAWEHGIPCRRISPGRRFRRAGGARMLRTLYIEFYPPDTRVRTEHPDTRTLYPSWLGVDEAGVA